MNLEKELERLEHEETKEYYRIMASHLVTALGHVDFLPAILAVKRSRFDPETVLEGTQVLLKWYGGLITIVEKQIKPKVWFVAEETEQ